MPANWRGAETGRNHMTGCNRTGKYKKWLSFDRDAGRFSGEVMTGYTLRKILARNKDFFLAKYLKPPPTFLGDPIPVTGDGRSTDVQ